jgi:hypothetical protein
MGPIGFLPVGPLFFVLWNKGPGSGDAWMPELTETKVFLVVLSFKFVG